MYIISISDENTLEVLQLVSEHYFKKIKLVTEYSFVLKFVLTRLKMQVDPCTLKR
jgi:hypothetical protein